MFLFPIQICFYCTGRMFEIIVKLKNKVAANQPFPDGVTWGIKITRYFYVFINQSVLTRSPTPLAEMQPQTMTVPQLCFHKKSFTKEAKRNLVSSLSKTSCYPFSVYVLCYLAHFSLFYLLKNIFLTVIVSLRPCLTRLRQTVHGLGNGQDVSLRSCVRVFFSYLYI